MNDRGSQQARQKRAKDAETQRKKTSPSSRSVCPLGEQNGGAFLKSIPSGLNFGYVRTLLQALPQILTPPFPLHAARVVTAQRDRKGSSRGPIWQTHLLFLDLARKLTRQGALAWRQALTEAVV